MTEKLFFRLGSNILRQFIRIPMESDPAPCDQTKSFFIVMKANG